MASFAPPVAPPTLERADTNKTMYPPGAWNDDGSSSARDDAGESPMEAVGNTLSSAFTAAGSMAANYLPASVVGQLANYAPGIVPQSAKGLDEVKNSNPPAPDVNKPNDRSLNTFSDSNSVDNSLNKPFDVSLDKPLNNAPNKPFDTSLDKPLDSSFNKTSPNDITPTQFASNVSGINSPGYGEQLSPVSITAATGHTPGISAPPSSAVTNSSAPSRDTSLPFGRTAGGSTDSESGYKSIGDMYPSSTSGAGSGTLNTTLPAVAAGTSGSMNSSDAGYKLSSDKEHNVPSSTISMKSGHIGSGPTHGALNTSVPPSRDASLPTETGLKSTGMSDSVTGNLPPIASPVDNGITPRASELEKEDLNYLAPAIASRDKIVPTTAAASKPLVETKFAEGSSAHPTPASPQSARSSEASGHSRNVSGASSVSVGGTPKRKVTLAKKIKGEAKILSGKLTKNTDKVQQGRDILNGDL